MGFNIYSDDGLYLNGYLSFNFHLFHNYWNIKKHLHGHKASTVLKYLKQGIQKLEEENIKPQILDGQDGWYPAKNVYLCHLCRLKGEIEKIIEEYPSHSNTRYWTDYPCDVDYDEVESEDEKE